MFGPLESQVFLEQCGFVSFIDDCTKVNWLYLIKNKSDASSLFPIFHKMVNK